MSQTSYRLSIDPALEGFRPEIEYVCDFLDVCYYLRRAPEAELVLHYGQHPPLNAVAVPAVLFPSGVRIDAEGLHPQRDKLSEFVTAKENGILPFGDTQPAERNFRYDAIGLIFFLLSRIEERGYPARDRYDRFPVTAALIAPKNARLYPFADRAARDIAAALTGDSHPAPRTRYEVMFTHDVDILKGYHHPFEPLRNALGDLVKRAQPAAALQRLRHAYLSGEPWQSMRRLMNLSERHGIQSRFYFMGPSDDPMDSPYVLRWPELVRSVADEMRARGHILGFHPGYYTYNNPAEWIRLRDGIESVIGAPLREGRHHVLRYDAAITPRIWSDAGMILDCTPSYPEVTGFRTGTCRPHHAYDLVRRKRLPLKQISTAAMEFGIFGGKYRDLSIEQAIADSVWAADQCREFGGTFALLFHTGQDEPRLWRWAEAVLEHAAH